MKKHTHSQTKGKAWYILIISVVVIGAILIFRSYSSKKEADIALSKQSSVPQVTLSVTPQDFSVTAGEKNEIKVNISSEKEVYAIDLYIKYDPDMLIIDQINSGDFFKDPMILANKIDNTNGLVTFSLASFLPLKKSGTLANLTIRGKKQGNTTISIDEKTLAGLKGGEKANITIVGNNEPK